MIFSLASLEYSTQYLQEHKKNNTDCAGAETYGCGPVKLDTPIVRCRVQRLGVADLRLSFSGITGNRPQLEEELKPRVQVEVGYGQGDWKLRLH